ncbi:HEAT repeat domain-containing protein, partial [Hydrocoleum sp. CS-953]
MSNRRRPQLKQEVNIRLVALVTFDIGFMKQYYVAERLLLQLSGMSDYELQWDYLNYLKWTEVVALILGLVEDEALAVRVVRLALEVDWFLGARLVGKVQGRFQERALVEVEGLELPGLVKVKLAGLTESDVAVPGLVKLLKDSDSDLRMRAADALGKIASETAIEALIPLLEDSDSDLRKRAAFALSKIGSETAIEALIPLREKSDSDEHSSSETAIPGLIPLLEYEDSYVCWNAAQALAKIGSETVIPELIPLLEYEDSYVRWNAVEALGEIGLVVEKSETVILRLIQMLEDLDSYVRRSAVESLIEIGSETAIPGLIQL